MGRAALVNIGDLTAYDLAKAYFMRKTGQRENMALHTAASIVAGFVGATFACPADVVKSRMMNQPTDWMGRGEERGGGGLCRYAIVKSQILVSSEVSIIAASGTARPSVSEMKDSSPSTKGSGHVG